MADTLWDAITRKATDFLEGGQDRTAALQQLGRDLEYYVPPELRSRIGLLAKGLEFTDAGDMPAAAEASRELWNNPSVGSAANYAAAGLALGLPFVSSRMMQEGVDVAGDAISSLTDDAKSILARLNQPGPVPTMYSNPIGGAIDEVDPRLGQEYEMVGADIAKSLEDVPTALEVMGKESMPHGAGFSAMRAQRDKILPEHYSRGILSSEMTPPVETDWQSKSGKTILGLVGDPTARKFIQQVGDEQLPSSVFSQAGAEFADINDWGWASDLGAMGPKLNAAAGVEDPYFVFLNMGEKSGDFAKHTGRLVGEAVRGARISSNAIPEIDDAIRNIGMSQNIPVMLPDGTQALTAKGNPKFKSVTVRPFSDFKSIADPDYLGNYIESLPSGTLRAGFIKGLDKSGLQKKGFPNIGELRMAMANPDLIGRDWLTAGYRGFTPDIEAGLIETTPDIHETYNTKIKKVGQSETLDQGGRGVPANLLFSDLAAEQRAKGTGGLLVPTSADYKVFEMSPYRAQQVMHDKAVEMVSTFAEIEQRFGRRAALEYANQLTQGGEITGQLIEAARKANAPTWMLAALAPSYGLLSQQDQEVQ